MNKCLLCPNKCGVNRTEQKGLCNTNATLKIARYAPHFYEEPVISGSNGSGAVFFCGCPLGCVFCQNYEVSRNTVGREISTETLAEIFSELENQGVHNINLVNPTHYVDKIIEAFNIYKPKIPIVYNTHGYENVKTLENIDKYIDIYLPDMKYFSATVSKRYSGKANYFEYAEKAIKFMANKKTVIENGLMKSGLIVRHLILPQNVNDSKRILRWYKENIPAEHYLSLMSQYTPFGKIENYNELQRKITKREYDNVLNELFTLNIENVFVQELSSADVTYIPDWNY